MPERFNPDSPLYTKPDGGQRHNLAFCAFSFGTRACPGRSIAMMMLKLIMIHLVKEFKYEVSQELIDQDMTITVGSEDRLFVNHV